MKEKNLYIATKNGFPGRQVYFSSCEASFECDRSLEEGECKNVGVVKLIPSPEESEYWDIAGKELIGKEVEILTIGIGIQTKADIEKRICTVKRGTRGIVDDYGNSLLSVITKDGLFVTMHPSLVKEL